MSPLELIRFYSVTLIVSSDKLVTVGPGAYYFTFIPRIIYKLKCLIFISV